ncbi:hypothetical protein [Candidatus Thiosymbion oneisti]|uniref:hypothetical protein n=1 Tax=Candidatus Thiosymbion oneisti TaxID=589554 RepID=UPI000B7D1AF0|nr:hypothetical protein [Candidatus Thiosymbion oneisti]
MKTLFINILIFLALVLAFDTISFWLLPARYVSQLKEYRRDSRPEVAGRNRYPRHYFVKHPQRGFDIGTNRQAYHWVEGVTYPIWSNSIGCFDREHTRYDSYVYFAGDSFTWGYTPFGEKFGTLIEKTTGVRILKCGVTHTGQRHQYQKFIEIAEQIGYLPQALFVFYYWNDVANDYAHPHSTVIDGWLVNSVSIDKNYRLVRHTDQELAQQVARRLKRHAERSSAARGKRIKDVLKRYSLTVNLIKSLRKQVAEIGQPDAAALTTPGFRNRYALMCKNRWGLGDIYALMCLATSEKGSWFSDNPMAQENKSALLDFRDFAERNDLPLIVVLIPVGPLDDPWRGDGLNTEHYREVRDFLDDQGIRFVDLTPRFHARGLTASEIYWKGNAHLGPGGNRAVAEILIEEFPQLFPK